MQSNVTPTAVAPEYITYPSLAISDGADGFPILVLAQAAAGAADCTAFYGTVVGGQNPAGQPVGTYASFALAHFKPFHGSVTLAN